MDLNYSIVPELCIIPIYNTLIKNNTHLYPICCTKAIWFTLTIITSTKQSKDLLIKESTQLDYKCNLPMYTH